MVAWVPDIGESGCVNAEGYPCTINRPVVERQVRERELRNNIDQISVSRRKKHHSDSVSFPHYIGIIIKGIIKSLVKGSKKISYYGDLVTILQYFFDELSNKIKSGQKLSFFEIQFLKRFFDLFPLFHPKDSHEAARLFGKYLEKVPSNTEIPVSSDIYTSSNRVIAAISKLEHEIKQEFMEDRTTKIRKPPIPVEADPSNKKLYYADYHFDLQSEHIREKNNVKSVYTVDGKYDFYPFGHPKGEEVFGFPYEGKTLYIPNGLLHHLVELGIANEFRHKSTWEKHWSLDD